MHSNIYVNLPVEDLKKSRAFFSALGYTFNENFCNEKGACVVMGENLFAMLLVRSYFKSFIKKDIADATKTTEVLVCVDIESRAAVDRHVDKAISLGATEDREPQDYGFMYGRAFHDLDGHTWEISWMDAEVAKNGPPQA